VSRDFAGSDNSRPLIGELFQTSVYKPNQGRIVRQLTLLVIWVIIGMGCWSLYGTLRGSLEAGSPMIPVIPGIALVAGFWFGYRIIQWPRFADFLIAVEAEMNKVTWPSKDELIRASIVVMFTIFFLAIALFLFDVVWQQFFSFIGVSG